MTPVFLCVCVLVCTGGGQLVQSTVSLQLSASLHGLTLTDTDPAQRLKTT